MIVKLERTMTAACVILVAEDEDNDFVLLERAWARHSAKTTLIRARDGVEVIDYLSGTNGFEDRRLFPMPDLLLLDLKMPRRGGLEVLQWLRTKSPCRTLLTVILSSSKEEKDVNQAYALGANSYLKKPTSYLEFLEMTNTLIEYWLRWVQRPQLNASLDQSHVSSPGFAHITRPAHLDTASE